MHLINGKIMEFTDQNFDQEVLKAKGVIVVDFWAEWCGPCQMLKPVIEELAKEYEGKAKVGKLNVDQNPDTAAKYGVMSIPTIKIFKDGEIVEDLMGMQPKELIKEKINQYL